jgi:hypothetical protein
LCTIFTCELKAQDEASQETAWRLMLEMAAQKGVDNIEIKGFMADNASTGWNAIRNVFFNGERRPEQERSDAFHFMQSYIRHSNEGVKEEKKQEHDGLWSRLRKAKDYITAHHIKDEIVDWYRQGNCKSGQMLMLMAWITWWVTRWRQ